MKAITILTAAVLTLQVFSLFASGTDTKTGSVSAPATYVESNTLAPVTPAEATFEEAVLAFGTPVDVEVLAPVTPMEAAFEDGEADFNDTVTPDFDITFLAPATPATADFEDIP